MARTPVPSKVIRGFQYVLENDFTGGLKTEFTGLNFPENACTSTENCTFFHTGAVFRRNGFDQELNNTTQIVDRTNKAISTFVWTNAGGDGNTKLFVTQVGATLSFYNISLASVSSPLSTQKLSATINIDTFTATGASSPDGIECQYAAGNGYLFVFNSNCDSFYCTYSTGVITAKILNLRVRDFVGIDEGVADNVRPTSLTPEHTYNLQNQGWLSNVSNGWNASSASNQNVTLGNLTFTVASGILGTTPGQAITFTGSTGGGGVSGGGTLVSYSGTTMVINITVINPSGFTGFFTINWNINAAVGSGMLATFNTAAGAYPSNADVWWSFKDSTGAFNPTATLADVTLSSGPAPKGSYILTAFNQQRTSVSGVAALTDISTASRPKTGTWFQGRVFYAGVDSSQPPTGDEPFYTWTETIYFSQIATSTAEFEKCYQTNDPTSETLFDLLPSDGGTIVIQGSGSIYKLFPITNGLLVFAANGIWFITGSTGIGFTATDYTVSKVSAIQNISSTSYIDILGYPMFWNEEGIYAVSMDTGQQGLTVNSVTLNTIKQFYDAIPLQSKKFARGSYNPITGQVQWIYRSTNESDVTSRYSFDSALTLSMFTQAFYPWTLPTSGPRIHDVTYIVGPGGVSSPLPLFKYFNSTGFNTFTFAEERDNVNWKDWNSTGSPVDYTSFFVTGYRLHGDAQRKWQPGYVYVYSDNAQTTSYKIGGRWNYAISGNSGKFSTVQIVTNNVNPNNFSKLHRRHKIRGMGTVLQLNIASVSGKPFHIDGWSVWETQNASV